MHQFHTLKIKEVKKETPSAVSLLFDIPSNLASLFHFTTGQYVTLKTSIDGTEVRRAYSICSSEKSGDLRRGCENNSQRACFPILLSALWKLELFWTSVLQREISF
jgi:hypothetical protein